MLDYRKAVNPPFGARAPILTAWRAPSKTRLIGALVRDRLEEAGPTGRTTVDYTVWTDVPKEALTIFGRCRG